MWSNISHQELHAVGLTLSGYHRQNIFLLEKSTKWQIKFQFFHYLQVAMLENRFLIYCGYFLELLQT